MILLLYIEADGCNIAEAFIVVSKPLKRASLLRSRGIALSLALLQSLASPFCRASRCVQGDGRAGEVSKRDAIEHMFFASRAIKLTCLVQDEHNSLTLSRLGAERAVHRNEGMT